MGPQPVRYAKFTQLPWEAILKMCAQKGDDVNYAKFPKKKESAGMVQVLVLTTDIAFEVWLVKPNLNLSNTPTNVELECVYRHKEDKVEMLDFIHMSHEIYTRSDSFYLKTDQKQKVPYDYE